MAEYWATHVPRPGDFVWPPGQLLPFTELGKEKRADNLQGQRQAALFPGSNATFLLIEKIRSVK